MATETEIKQENEFVWTQAVCEQMKIARDKRVKEAAREMAMQIIAVAVVSPWGSFADAPIPLGLSAQANAISRILCQEPYNFVTSVVSDQHGPRIRFDFTRPPGETMDPDIKAAIATTETPFMMNKREGKVVVADTLPVNASVDERAAAMVQALAKSGGLEDTLMDGIKAAADAGDKDAIQIKALLDAGILSGSDIAEMASSSFKTGVKIVKRAKPSSATEGDE